MTARFWGDGEYNLLQVAEEERKAIYHLFQREIVKYRESIVVYVNPEENASYPIRGRYAQFMAEEGHIVSASFSNCLRGLGTLPKELRSCKNLKKLSFWNTPGFLLSADPTYFRALEELHIREGPMVMLNPIGANISLTDLVVRGSRVIIPRGMHCFPNLRKADFSYCGMDKVPDISEARSLEELDLSNNSISSYAGMKNPGRLKKVDLRGNGFWRRLANYRKNKRVVEELRQNGVEVYD